MDRARIIETASKERPRSRIMDRKILPSGFSVFNPGGGSGGIRFKSQTACFFSPSSEMTSATQQQQSRTGRSVQEIVRWMEKAENAVTITAGVAAPPVSEHQSSNQLKVARKPATPSTTAASSRCTNLTPSRELLIAAAASSSERGEKLKDTSTTSEYTPLTMLEYRAYMNNRPLGRCLDDYAGVGDLLLFDDDAATVKALAGDSSPDSSSCQQFKKLATLARGNHDSDAEPEKIKDKLDIIKKGCPPRGTSGDAVFALDKAGFSESQPVDMAMQLPIMPAEAQATPSKGQPSSPKESGNKAKESCTGSSSVNGQRNTSCNTARTFHLIHEPEKTGALPFKSIEKHMNKLRTPSRLHVGPETGAHGTGGSTNNQHTPKGSRRSDERHGGTRGSLETTMRSRDSHSLEEYQAGRRQQKPAQPATSTAMTAMITIPPPVPTESPYPPSLYTVSTIPAALANRLRRDVAVRLAAQAGAGAGEEGSCREVQAVREQQRRGRSSKSYHFHMPVLEDAAATPQIVHRVREVGQVGRREAKRAECVSRGRS
ncbi:hypothetical protein OOU_Y34scaffold00936g14 [Pyricularia oryzae Y34]|uniref:Uncharacterized protein n=1 Tax=Pyricularia oryzae (strain Y34) TaxID=1143189 RepID=A0AA97PG95_PYRO3|nr:hypothetical protein OOU_Y34scaffold00936g14 [Pyricularia oryzae Y34]